MKILFLSLFLLTACKTPTTEDFNPMDSYFDLNLGSNFTLGAQAESYMDMVDSHRQSMGLPAFIHSDEIADEARLHAENMAKGVTPFGTSGSAERCARIKTNLGMGALCGENVARGQKTAAEVFTVWMSTDTSRNKLQSTRFTHSAMVAVERADGEKFWVQIFLEVP